MDRQISFQAVRNTLVSVIVLLLAFQHDAFAVTDVSKNSLTPPTLARSQIASDRILVRFKDTSAATLRTQIHRKFNARVLNESQSVRGLHVVRVASPARLVATLDAYRRDPNVLYAEPDYRLQFYETLPNDPMFSSLWALHNTGLAVVKPGVDIKAVRAWDITTGRADVYVGVVDTGVDYNHADLAANVWVNEREIAANGIDDDLNGYIDDIHGINSPMGSGDPMDTIGHGSHVSGTIAAQGNNSIGVTGVNWNAKLIACSLIDAESLSAFVSGAVKCLDYLYALKTQRGLDIVATNNSWGWAGGPSQALKDAITRQNDAGILFVAAAGNSAIDNTRIPHYPASYDLPNVISVAASDNTDHKAPFSNYGRTSVHIAAPGVGILSTTLDDAYETHSGTSMASPHVVGVLALLKAQDMTRNWISLKNLLLAGGERVESMGFTITGRRLLAAGDNGTGALTCENQSVMRRLSPRKNSIILSYGAAQTLNLSLLSLECAQPGINPHVIVAETNQSITTLDDGLHNDGKAGDGIFGAQFPIPKNQQEDLTLLFPDGDSVNVSFQSNYAIPTVTASQWRDLSSNAQEVFLGENTTHVLPLPFPLHIAERAESYDFVAITANGFIVPVVGEAAAYAVNSSWLNLPLPVEYLDTLLAPF